MVTGLGRDVLRGCWVEKRSPFLDVGFDQMRGEGGCLLGFC